MASINTTVPDTEIAEIAENLRVTREWEGTDTAVLKQWLNGIVAGEVKTSTLRTATAALKAATTDTQTKNALFDLHNASK